MTPHTPGPWYTSVTGDGIVVNTEKHVKVAVVEPLFVNGKGARNARLIAAAPDLLDALEHALNWAEGFETATGSILPWTAQAQTASTRAKGKKEPHP